MKENTQQPVKLGMGGLTAIVFCMVVGAGIYNIPQNMAAEAALGPVVISWLVTAVVILLLVATLKTLADRRPDLDAGIYQYGQAGWGKYMGFNLAWGYWLSACFSNIAYSVMLNDSFGAFFPWMLNNPWSQVIFGSIFIWLMFLIVSEGMRTAKALNNLMAVIKITSVVIIGVLLGLNIKSGMFNLDVWGTDSLGDSVMAQVKNTMMVTLWCFIGIEGAVMMSSRAKDPDDVGRAGVAGFLIAWLLYIMVSVLCFGVMSQRELAGLDNPSVAYVLKSTIGDWAYYLVIVAVILSLLGGWVSWTLICAQVPYEGARVGILPRRFLKLNKHEMPTYGLAASSIIMQLFLLLVVTASDVYMAALSIVGMMILPTYLFSALYLWKSTLGSGYRLGTISHYRNIRFRLTAIACTGCCLWMIYSGGLGLLLLTSGFYLFGVFFYIKARRDASSGVEGGPAVIFTRGEKIMLISLIACTILSIVLLATGSISI